MAVHIRQLQAAYHNKANTKKVGGGIKNGWMTMHFVALSGYIA
jgi:hypothetical protein